MVESSSDPGRQFSAGNSSLNLLSTTLTSLVRGTPIKCAVGYYLSMPEQVAEKLVTL